MNKINCSVENCSHNSSGVCYANRIDVGSKGATDEDQTCCGSFLDRKHYSTLTNNTNDDGPCDCIVCTAENCTYNNNKLCTADVIQVTGDNVRIYTEAICSTFKMK
ncbi:DUF1540 domain-containing protein [Romboutsia sp. 13368]|uniref:DUF1540 domain-containing protein n=1 Tax=Romboutsia sp. 13368 TaxID=2708053 RepID=UPI0025FEF2B4|nr:DUF1540 domain-containing protein [Romboutsia sp. 13368]